MERVTVVTTATHLEGGHGTPPPPPPLFLLPPSRHISTAVTAFGRLHKAPPEGRVGLRGEEGGEAPVESNRHHFGHQHEEREVEKPEQHEQRAAQGQGSGQWRSWSSTSSGLPRVRVRVSGGAGAGRAARCPKNGSTRRRRSRDGADRVDVGVERETGDRGPERHGEDGADVGERAVEVAEGLRGPEAP